MELSPASLKFLIVLTLELLKLPDAVRGECNETALNTCLKPFKPYESKFRSFSIESSNITAACDAFTAAKQCVRLHTGCAYLDASFGYPWALNQHFYSYICGSGREGYIKHRPCLAGQPLQSNWDNCMELLNNNISAQATFNQSNLEHCKTYNDQFFCSGTKAGFGCSNPEAGKYLTRLLMEEHGPLLRHFYSCCIVSDGKTTTIQAGCSTKATPGFIYTTAEVTNISGTGRSMTPATTTVRNNKPTLRGSGQFGGRGTAERVVMPPVTIFCALTVALAATTVIF